MSNMLNKKILVTFLSFSIFMLIYLLNQAIFMNILVDPLSTKYSWIDDQYTGYLISDTPNYIDNALLVDEKSDVCMLFFDYYTKRIAYTNECELDGAYYSESILNESGNSFSSIYEHIYGFAEVNSIDSYNQIEFPRYNQIFVANGNDITGLLSEEVNVAVQTSLVTTYSQSHLEKLMNNQIFLVMLISLSLFMVFIFGYLVLKSREYNIYRLLGVRSNKIFKIMATDILVMVFIAFIIAFTLFAIIAGLNGWLFYIEMYFEYFDIVMSLLLYVGISALMLLITYILHTILNNKAREQ